MEKEASSLRELLIIRFHNREYIESINGNLGSVLGFKKYTNEPISNHPAIIVFVKYKINPKWLPDGKIIPEKLFGPEKKVWCYLDVVEGNKADYDDFVEMDYSNTGDRLRGWDEQLWIGSQLSTLEKPNEPNSEILGTLGAFVKQKGKDSFGILTNQHVGLKKGQKIYHPYIFGTHIGTTKKAIKDIEDEKYYENIGINEKKAFVRVDAAYVEFSNNVNKEDINSSIMQIGELGPVKDISLNNMNIVGQKVLHIGRTTGIRFGTILGYGYEWHDEEYSRYADLLILGDDGIPFSTGGDSGSLIVTDDEYLNPIAMMWGGWTQKLDNYYGQENWTYATSLKRILEYLDLELIYNTEKLKLNYSNENKPELNISADSTKSRNLISTYLVIDPMNPCKVDCEIEDDLVYMDGDIVLGSINEVNDLNQLLKQRSISTSIHGKLWPRGVVPFTINANAQREKLAIERAINDYNRVGFRFVRRRNERDFIEFRISNRNGSKLGRQGGIQFITLIPNIRKGVVLHEIGHALGLLHEHNRPDRDRFIRIIPENVIPNCLNQFSKKEINTMPNSPYDYGSVMHYGMYAFSRNNRPTIVPRMNANIGENGRLSTLDINGLRKLYNL